MTNIQGNFKPIQNSTQSKLPQTQSALMSLGKVLDFSNIFSEVMASSQYMATSSQLNAERKKKLDQAVGNAVESIGINGEVNVYAQVQGIEPGVQGAAANANVEVVNRVPLQLFLDKTIESLDNLSRQELRVNDLIEGFVEGKVSEDEVVVETAKLNLSMQMVTTIVQFAIQSFKEILQIAV